ncbi:aminotransferase class IV family protein [Xanthobacter sp.]|uniref:aminotransferase class IV family protein n=1 Tax=Xanthobacter sp. TaxID=35809 RepID=UPI0025D57C49|nr:aminotransferase class IV family protein [Xanthobacter sp.]
MNDSDRLTFAQIDGQPATVADLAPLAFAGFAHFTAMQVRRGRVRGLDLHLARLRAASLALFDADIPDDQVRSQLRSAVAVAGSDALSLTATVFTRSGEFNPRSQENDLSLLIRTSPASNGPECPLRLAVVQHERVLPSFKHTGETAKTYYLRDAGKHGFDDAIFLDRHGCLSEATIWNVAYWDGSAVVWPIADVLTGVTMGILQRQLKKLGVPQREVAVTPDMVGGFSGAVVMNSWTPGVSINAIAGTAIPAAPQFVELLHTAYLREPEVEI